MLSWLNPLMLYGAAAVAVPLIMHLLLRRRTRRVVFSRLILLTEVRRFSERYFRLKQLLLMALRILAILLLVAAFARPWWRHAQPAAAGPALSVAAVLDVSASMGAQDRYAEAVSQLRDRFSALRPGDQAALIVAGRKARVVVPFTGDPARLLAALDNLPAAGFEAGDLAAGLQAGSEILAEAGTPRRTLLLASDLQRTGLRMMDPDWRVPNGVQLEIIRVGQPEPNAGVADAVVASLATADKPGAVRALIGDYGGTGERPVEITLEAGGRKIATQSVVMVAGTRRIVEFALPATASGVEGTIRIGADSLDADNQRHFLLPTSERRRVLLVGEPNASGEDEGLYPKMALEVGADSPYRVDRITPTSLNSESPEEAQLVIEPSVTAIAESSRQWLTDCAQAGGTVLIAAGKDTAATDGRCALADVQPVGWIESPADSGTYQTLADVDLRNVIFASFRGPGRGNFTALNFRAHLNVAPGPTSAILATFDDGSPALIERPIGKGRVLLWTTGLGPSVGNFPLRGLYVAWMRSIAATAFASAESYRSLLVGDAAPLSGQPGETLAIHRPNGETVQATLDAEGSAVFTGTDVPGLYRVEGKELSAFVVNVDSVESDLDFAPEPDLLALAEPAEVTSSAASTAVATDEAGRAARIWKALLGALLIVALVELWLANTTPR